jgi:hypothetical protein
VDEYIYTSLISIVVNIGNIVDALARAGKTQISDAFAPISDRSKNGWPAEKVTRMDKGTY